MKIKPFLAFLCFLLSVKGFSQNTISLIDEVVEQIKLEIPNLRMEYMAELLNGYKRAFYKDKVPLIIEVEETERIKKNVCWYYFKENLIFTETVWTDTVSGRKLHHEKTYHSKDRMIVWMDNESTFVDASSSEYINLEKALSAYSKKIYLEAKQQ